MKSNHDYEGISFTEALAIINNSLKIKTGFDLKDRNFLAKIDFLELPGTDIKGISGKVALLLSNIEDNYASPFSPGIALNIKGQPVGFFDVIPNLDSFSLKMQKKLLNKIEQRYDCTIVYNVAPLNKFPTFKCISLEWALTSPMKYWLRFICNTHFPSEFRKNVCYRYE